MVRRMKMTSTKAETTSALVMLSGGLDSAVALFWALQRRFRVETITFDYFLRTAKERRAAIKLAKLTRTKQHVIGVGFMREIEDAKVEDKNPDLSSAPSAYISSRNMIFYSIATSLAELTSTKYIVGGHNKDDSNSFPDCSSRFFRQFNKTTSIGLYTNGTTGRVILPLTRLSKAQVISLGVKLGVPYDLTWSCYRSQPQPCGKCHSCLLRAAAFTKAGVADPLLDG